jgi:hypothetical protein
MMQGFAFPRQLKMRCLALLACSFLQLQMKQRAPKRRPEVSTSIKDLPQELQHLIFASAAAPLTTCKASAAITSDASLVATGLLVKHEQPLAQAAKHQLWEVCDQLLSSYQYTPDMEELKSTLVMSAQQGRTALIGSLLQWCCRVHHENCGVCLAIASALSAAAEHGHFPTVSFIMQHPSIDAQAVRCAVCEAAACQHLAVLDLLLSSRPDGACSTLRHSPMYYAAFYGHRQAMQLLMQHGADINGRCGTPWSDWEEKYSPMRTAAEMKQYDTVAWMLEHGADATAALEDAAKLGGTTFPRLLLDWGVDVKSTGADAIRTALWRCLYSVVHLLLSAGPADYFMSGAQERTRMGSFIRHCVPQIKPGEASALLQAAVQHEHTSFAQMLRSAGAVLTSSASV